MGTGGEKVSMMTSSNSLLEQVRVVNPICHGEFLLTIRAHHSHYEVCITVVGHTVAYDIIDFLSVFDRIPVYCTDMSLLASLYSLSLTLSMKELF